MNLLPKKVKIKPIIIAIILLILLLFAEGMIKSQKETIKDLSKNTAQVMYTTVIGNKTFDITNAVASIPNFPTMSAGMIPIKFEGAYWTITSTDDNSWYDYSNGKPAYVMLNDGVHQSEIVQNMKNKKLAKEHKGKQIQDKELGTIYMWLPRYAYNETGEIIYIKQGYNIAGSWTTPEVFMYETDKMDYSLAGIWVEYNPLANSMEVTSKISNMLGEENVYGFISNTKPVSMTSKEQNAIEQYTENASNNLIIDTQNVNRTILKIINTNQIEPIKAKVTYKNEKVVLELIYFKNDIKQVLTEKGKELIKTSTNTYELENLDDVTYTYKIM